MLSTEVLYKVGIYIICCLTRPCNVNNVVKSKTEENNKNVFSVFADISNIELASIVTPPGFVASGSEASALSPRPLRTPTESIPRSSRSADIRAYFGGKRRLILSGHQRCDQQPHAVLNESVGEYDFN